MTCNLIFMIRMRHVLPCKKNHICTYGPICHTRLDCTVRPGCKPSPTEPHQTGAHGPTRHRGTGDLVRSNPREQPTNPNRRVAFFLLLGPARGGGGMAAGGDLTEDERKALRGSKFAPLPAPPPSSRPNPRMAHPGGPLTTNKAAALAKFLERKLQQPDGLDSLNPDLVNLAVKNAKETIKASKGEASTSGRVVRHVPSFEDSSEVSNQDDGEQRQEKKKKKKKKKKRKTKAAKDSELHNTSKKKKKLSL
ncbi:hypothetical protein VPH35_027121 [Triticum aestivum]